MVRLVTVTPFAPYDTTRRGKNTKERGGEWGWGKTREITPHFFTEHVVHDAVSLQEVVEPRQQVSDGGLSYGKQWGRRGGEGQGEM